MQEQLVAYAKVAAAYRAAEYVVDEQNVDASGAKWLGEQADAADEHVARLEHNIADATARLAIMSRGLPDPGVGPDPF